MRGPVVSLLLPILLFLLTAPPARAEDSAPPGYPAILGEHGGPWARAHYPVRVRKLEKIEWKFGTGSKTGMSVPGRDGLVRVMSGGGNICGVDAATGKGRFWVAGNHRFWNYSSCVLGPDGTAYGGNFGWISAVRPDGKVAWRTDLNASWIHRSPALSPDGKTLYVGADNLGLASLDAATGNVNWLRRDFKSPWTLYTFDSQGRLVAGIRDRVVCFERDGREAWEMAGGVSSLMTVGGLLVVSRGKSLEVVDPATRKPRFSIDLGATIHGTALGDDGRIVVSLRSGEMAQVDQTGRVRWKRRISGKRLSRPVTAAGGETVVMDLAGRVFLLDSNGLTVSSIETGASFWTWRPSIGPDGHVYVNHDNDVLRIGGTKRERAKPVRSTSILVVADDFVVDVWVNGRLVPLSSRQRLAEVFGAMTERVHVDLRDGDWVVFNVVANRMRWGGASYFGAYATDDDGQVGFVSNTTCGWYACDDPSKVASFIEDRDAGTDRKAVAPERPWRDAKDRWRGQLGKDFPGEPVWGRTANTWIKHIVGHREAGSILRD